MAFEKVSPQHPDKMCDRLAGAILDLAYSKEKNPRIAVEVLAGHGKVFIIIETSLSREQLSCAEIDPIVWRIFGNDVEINVTIVPQDPILAHNQDNAMRVADNGIFRGVPPTEEQRVLTHLASEIYKRFPYDGKYIIHGERKQYTTVTGKPIDGKFHNVYGFTICQSHMSEKDIMALIEDLPRTIFPPVTIGDNDDPYLAWHYNLDKCKFNPLGEWTGGPNTDSGATNRKLGSDMGDGVTGGGLHGKDLSKADVSVNIWCYLESIRTGHQVTASCSIGDETVKVWSSESNAESHSSIAESRQSSPIGNGIPYKDIVEQARLYIHTIGGFEKFAEWGLVRPLAQV